MKPTLVLTCILGWGLWCHFEAKAVSSAGVLVTLVVSLLTYAVAGVLLLASAPDLFAGVKPAGVLWGVGASLCSLVAIASYLLLVSRQPAHLAAALTAVYPLVPALIAIASGSALGFKNGAGIVLCCAGAVVLSWR